MSDALIAEVTTWEDIPGWCSNFLWLYDEQINQAAEGARFVELGAWLGRSTAYMASQIRQSGKQIHFTTIDNWICRPWMEPLLGPDPAEVDLYERFCHFLTSLNLMPYVEIIKGDSINSAARFEDNSLDFIFLDTTHQYEQTLWEITVWYPKLKPGGVFAGDDYTKRFDGLRKAVKQVFADNVAIRNSVWKHIKPA